MADFNEIYSLLTDYAQVGFMEAVKAYEPTQDRIRKSEVLGWLKMMRIDIKKFHALVAERKIKPFRIGASKNSPLYYSKKEIKQAVASAKVASLLTRYQL